MLFVRACARVARLLPGTSSPPLATASLCRKARTGNDRWIWLFWPSLEMVRHTHTHTLSILKYKSKVHDIIHKGKRLHCSVAEF